MRLGEHLYRKVFVTPMQKRVVSTGVKPTFQVFKGHLRKEEILDESADYVYSITHGIFTVAFTEAVGHDHIVHFLGSM